MRVLAGVSASSIATFLLVLMLWFGLIQKAGAFSPLDLFQSQPAGTQSKQSNQRPERSDAALFKLFGPERSGAQGSGVSAYANDTDLPEVYGRHRSWRHAHHHRRREQEASASVSNASSGASPSAPSVDAGPPWKIATAPAAMQPEPSAVSTLQIVLITQDGGDPFERCMTAYYWSRLNHALQVDQIFDPAPRYAVDATSPDVTRHLAKSWIESSVGR
ncbi:MAG: hypothetical protein J2P54_15865 [Bradyrhizobiaceae bacterium]|nr:hypothetical protein [Bradyrhizobiaceae bacterium]